MKKFTHILNSSFSFALLTYVLIYSAQTIVLEASWRVLSLSYSVHNINYFYIQIINAFAALIISIIVYVLLCYHKHKQFRADALINNIPAVVFQAKLDDRFTITFINDEIKNLSGIDKDKFFEKDGIGLLDLINLDECDKIKADIREKTAKGEPIDLEFRLCSKRSASGTTVRFQKAIWARLRGKAFINGQNNSIIFEGYLQNITERKMTEYKLIENQRYFSDLANSLPNLLWITNIYGDCLFFNKTWQDFTGLSSDASMDLGWTHLIHQDDKDAVRTKMTSAIAGEREFEAWMRIMRHDGVYRWMLVAGVPRYSTTGQLEGMICSATDITERKHYEVELKSANKKLESFFVHSPVAIAVFDTDLNCLKSTQKWADELGSDIYKDMLKTSSIGKHVKDYISLRLDDLLGGISLQAPCVSMTQNSGAKIWYSLEVHPISEDGELVTLIAFFENITAQKNNEEEIREHRDHLQDLVSSQTQKLVEESEKNILLRSVVAAANEATDLGEALSICLELVCDYGGWAFGHGYFLDDVHNVLVSSGAWSQSAEREFSDLKTYFSQTSIPLVMNHILPVRCFLSGRAGWQSIGTLVDQFPKPELIIDAQYASSYVLPLTISGMSIGVFEFFSFDISEPDEDMLKMMENVGLQLGRVIERFRQEENLKKAKDLAEQNSRIKSDFLSNMSHELRTPMHAILNYAGMSLKKISHIYKEAPEINDGKVVKYLSNIQNAGNRLLELLNNLLDLAKMESGKMDFHFIEHSLVDIVDQACIELESLLTLKKITLEYDIDSPSLKVRLDQQRMMQVMVNLFSNAIKFTPESSQLTIKICAATDERIGGDGVFFSLTDQGVGIPEGEIDKIFEVFTQSSATKSGAGGTGLGLSIARQIIDAHNGRIWAHNTNLGASFCILLPNNPEEVQASFDLGQLAS